jgi:hypothetical protein
MNEHKPPGALGEPGPAQHAGGSGRSREDAVVILGATTTWQGFQAEREWLECHFPGFIKAHQLLIDDHRFDLIAIETVDGEALEIWFEISEFIGW